MKAAKKPSNPFKVPSGYLESFEVQLPKSLDTNKRNSPKKHKHAPFQVPSGYFDGFSVKKIQDSNTPPSLPLYKKYAWMAAAAVLLVVMTTPFIRTNVEPVGQEVLANTAIDSYWEYATDALTPYDMAAYVEATNDNPFDTDSPLSPSLEGYLESQIHPLETLELNSNEND